MDEKGIPWQNIIILLIIFGGSILRFIFQNRGTKEKPQGQAGHSPRARSPALEILEKLRQENESVAARQAQAPAAGIPAERPGDFEDAYYGDDGLEGVSPLVSTEVTAATEKRPPASETQWKDVSVDPVNPPPAREKRRSGDRIPGTIRAPREEVLQPHSTDLQAGVSAPRTQGLHVSLQTLGLEKGLAVHTSTGLSVRRGAGHLRLPAALGGGRLSLRQAIIGQIILGPPKTLEKRAGPPRGRL